MEASSVSAASAPAEFEQEPAPWQPRALWFNARLLCGATSFFFLAFLFGYFYLRSLDENNAWKIGTVNPPVGLGLAAAALFVASAIIFRLGAHRPDDTLATGVVALVLALAGIAVQCIALASLGFGPASGGYASIYVGWTAFYALFALFGAYWVETQVATLWRTGGSSGVEAQVIRAGVEACSFYWGYFAAIGVLAFVVLYLV